MRLWKVIVQEGEKERGGSFAEVGMVGYAGMDSAQDDDTDSKEGYSAVALVRPGGLRFGRVPVGTGEMEIDTSAGGK